VSLLATPFLMSVAPRLAEVLLRRADREPDEERLPAAAPPAVVLIGYGLTGRTLARALDTCGLPYVAVETNARTVARARAAGEPVIFGDATRRVILVHAGVRRARLVSIAVSDPLAARRILGLVRAVAPEARVVVRTRYVAEMDALYELGASLVVAEEFEATLDMLSAVLRSLGIPGEAVERFADDLRSEGYEALRIPPALLLDPWLAAVLRDVTTEWVEVPEGEAAGRSIGELGVRARTGASVVAVRSGETTRVNPPPDRRLAPGDRVLVVGDAEALARLRALLGGAPSPAEAREP
jgi:CPA2 family monovalent cation:H+ antiporter-2